MGFKGANLGCKGANSGLKLTYSLNSIQVLNWANLSAQIGQLRAWMGQYGLSGPFGSLMGQLGDQLGPLGAHMGQPRA